MLLSNPLHMDMVMIIFLPQLLPNTDVLPNLLPILPTLHMDMDTDTLPRRRFQPRDHGARPRTSAPLSAPSRRTPRWAQVTTRVTTTTTTTTTTTGDPLPWWLRPQWWPPPHGSCASPLPASVRSPSPLPASPSHRQTLGRSVTRGRLSVSTRPQTVQTNDERRLSEAPLPQSPP